ncbi:heterokaryon incompatibility protein-domain-containing protein [Amylocarpus encephaloides]|uniref:Heterokaryon incompatibility protein-domain-containing protein n=1 Tax=Amylocarpus encephaloides TaxID=45428 RepID=A0A9P8C3D0_9HELO|nr:heterokaryon incompatibility protein-domain-containing protein [Amylocarpus encephaloides]
MCCKRRAARRNGAMVYQQRRKTLIRMIIEHFIEKREQKRAVGQNGTYETAFAKSPPRAGAAEEGRFVDVERVVEERDSWAGEEWDLVDEKKQLQMLEQSCVTGLVHVKATNAMSGYSYQSLLPDPGNIRLLRLKPDEDETAPIQCELFNYSLQKSNKGTLLYEALSYVWGDPKETSTIRLDGYRSIERIIWVDAVCIDQEKSQEKEHQIQLMAKIYGQATRVIVWLGEAADESDLAVEEIRIAGSKKSTDSLNEPVHGAILALLGRVWFRRIWVGDQTLATSPKLLKVNLGSILGKISLKNSGTALEDSQDVDIIFQNTLAQPGYIKEWSAHWTFHASARSIRDGGLVCLLQGASKPTVIRQYKDHFVIITIAVAPTIEVPMGGAHIKWPELLQSITTFPRDFLLIWDWEGSPERWQDRDYESLMEINSQVPKDSKTELEDDLHKATRVWNVVAILKDSEMDKEARQTLDLILENSTSVPAPEKHLDKIYITSLSLSFHIDCTGKEREESSSTLKDILGSLVVLSSQLSTYALGKLLHITKQEVNQTLVDLHTILDIPEDQTRLLSLHHPSFRHFLLSKDRCTDSKFWVDEKHAHRMLAENCIRLMSMSLKQDICGLGTPGVLTTDIKNTQVEQYLPSEVQYACVYWVQHLQKSDTQLYDNDRVYRFLEVYLLY